MRVELLGAIDDNKLEKELRDKNIDNADEIVAYIQLLEKQGRLDKVALAGRLSRFAGDVFEVLGVTSDKSYETNLNFVKRVINMGHDSITDHDYLVFGIKDVSPVIEQTIIAERFSSFTIKSRREVDFSNVGFYTPNFRNQHGKAIENQEQVKIAYQDYMNHLFAIYKEFIALGLPKEDARFILPYCYYSNCIMGVDAHTLKDMIIKFTKTHLSRIQELKEFGEKLYEIAKENIPYIIDEIEKTPYLDDDPVRSFIDREVPTMDYRVLDRVKLLNSSDNVDDTILLSALMRRYQYDRGQAVDILKKIACDKADFKETLMQKICFEGDKLELSQVSFQFQIPISLAILTHLTRHRTQQILIPEFSPIIDLKQYKIPPKVMATCPGRMEQIFDENYNMCQYFKSKYGICDEDLIYFSLSGNMVNVISNMDGKTVEHILRLRECGKSQWETQQMARGIHMAISELDHAKLYSNILGPTCMTQGYCKEGKESCGRIKMIVKH